MEQELIAPHLDAIYGVAREDFTSERDRRVKELRAAGHRDEAGALAKQRKPTVSAWAVDQLARSEPATIEALIEEADGLREAQRRAASGRGSDGLREASRQVRELVAQLRDRAREVIEDGGGQAAAHLDDIERTLFTAAVEPEHHEHLRHGWFATPLEGSGFGGMSGLTVVPDAPEDAAEPDAREADVLETADGAAEQGQLERRDQERREQERREQERREQERREQERREQQRRELERRQEALEQQRDQLRRSRDRQLRRVERAEAAAQELEDRAAAARADAEQERDELTRIDDDLHGLEDDLQGLGEDLLDLDEGGTASER